MEKNGEKNIQDEMPQLSCLLEKHKQLQERSIFKSLYQEQAIFSNINNYHDSNFKNCTSDAKLPNARMNKVYVNPNYTRRKPVIHINPHVQVKPSIYVNPKLIHKISNSQNPEQIQTSINDGTHMNQINIQSKCSVHVNPKLMTKLISKVPEKHNTVEETKDFLNSLHSQSTCTSFEQDKSSYISLNKSDFSNCLMTNQSDRSLASNKKKPVLSTTFISPKKSNANYIIRSKTKLVKNSVIHKKNPNSTLIALSQRKLVRIKKNPKLISISSNFLKSLTPLKKRYFSGIRKTKMSPKHTSLCSVSQILKTNNVKMVANPDKTKWYNKGNNTVSRSSHKKINLRKISNTSAGLVSIGGIMYKTSRNQLVRSNPGISLLKRRRSLSLSKNSQYFITKNGKKLLKLDSTNKRNNNVKNISNVSIRNFKTDASNKVKRKSLQILRNKMRKNNQPCLLFQKFGYCNNQLTGSCSKLHDTKQVSLCKNFLQGRCVLNNCPLSHNVGPEKMPTCRYFLEGCCTRDECPYLHVKLSSKNPICIEFLRGYCPQGNECQKRHINVCPEFDKSGKCSKGKFCPYPHKSHLTETKRCKGSARDKSNATSTRQLQRKSTKSEIVEYNKRYYDGTSEDLSQKRETLLNQVKIIKDMHAAQLNNISTEKTNRDKLSGNDNSNETVELENTLETVCNRRRKRPIGSLPAYIPIN